MADSRRVLLVSALPPPPGGIQTWTQMICRRGLPEPYAVDVVDARVTRRHQDIPPRLNLAELRRFVSVLYRIWRSLSTRRYSIVHLNCALTATATPRNYISAAICRLANVPYVLHLHGTLRLPRRQGAAARLYRYAFRYMAHHAAAIIALGSPSHRAVLELGPYSEKTVRLLPNFVDTDAATPRTSVARSGEPMKVVFTGALTAAKGVRTIGSVAERLPDVWFQLVGDAPPESRDALVRHLRERRLADRVQVLGPVEHDEIAQLLPACDVFFFPSQGEGFPNSVAEAMAAGLPVVASDVGAVPEMIDVGKGGYLAAPGDVTEYAAALARLRDDPELRRRMGDYNLRKARREYDYAIVVRRLCAIYDCAVARTTR